jgi:hypothetical protein
MDAATATNKTPPSLHSNPSSTNLDKHDASQPPVTKQEEPRTQPDRYLYYKKTGRAPNPDAQLKPKSKLSSFLSKFQSPAVKKTNDARDRELLEEERRGVKIYTATGVPTGADQNTGAYMAGGIAGN